MDEPDSYPFLNEPLLIGAFQQCRHSSFFGYPHNKNSLSSQETALMEFMIKLEKAYQYQLSLKKVSNRGRVLPPVPKFEDSELEPTPAKKVKTVNNSLPAKNLMTATNTQHSGSFIVARPQYPISQSSENHPSESPSSLMRVNKPCLSQNKETFAQEQKNQSNSKSFCNDSRMSHNLEEFTVKPSAKSAHSNPFLASDCSSSPEIELDKKDLKKFQKFESCFREYLQKLSITNPAVEKKYLEFLRLVVPQLSTHFKSKPFEAIAAAILLYACREVQHPITIKQITQVTEAKEKLINKCIFSLKEILPNKEEMKYFRADEFILVIGDKLVCSDVIKQAGLKIHQNIEKLNFIKSNHAATLACCCLKFACTLSGEDKGFDEIAEAAGINKMTLRNMYRELFPYRFGFITEDCHLLKSPSELPNL